MAFEGNYRHNSENQSTHRYTVPNGVGFLATHRGLSSWATRRSHDLDELPAGIPDAETTHTTLTNVDAEGRGADGSYHSQYVDRAHDGDSPTGDTPVGEATIPIQHPQGSEWEARFTQQRRIQPT